MYSAVIGKGHVRNVGAIKYIRACDETVFQLNYPITESTGHYTIYDAKSAVQLTFVMFETLYVNCYTELTQHW